MLIHKRSEQRRQQHTLFFGLPVFHHAGGFGDRGFDIHGSEGADPDRSLHPTHTYDFAVTSFLAGALVLDLEPDPPDALAAVLLAAVLLAVDRPLLMAGCVLAACGS